MAIRGVLTTIGFYLEDAAALVDPIYEFQNHFPEPRVIVSGDAVPYNSFQTSSINSARDSTLSTVDVVFAGTAANVDLVEEATVNRYTVAIVVYRWNRNEGIDDPTGYNAHSVYVADAIGGTADLSTVTLKLGRYSDNTGADMPWRKIPWTILGPLSFRR